MAAILESAPRTTRILIVDDEAKNVELLARYLARGGYAVTTATHGEEALEKVHAEIPDVLLVDIAMPVMDGLSVCRALRKDVRTRSLPIILVTAHGTLEGYRAGADDYVIKPFDLGELKTRIECAFQRRRWDLAVHPLTRLPGSPGIEEELRKRLAAGDPFAFAYLDIDFFKAYNDAYGYEAGDRVIKMLANLLIDASVADPPGAFAGHVGGDDFVFIASIDHMTAVLPAVANAFDVKRGDYYRPEDLAECRIESVDRQGRRKIFPLMTLSVAVVTTQTRTIAHPARLIEIASEIKQFVKTKDHEGKSICLWDRRRDREA
jgi:PleD family two-component response regulator